MVLLIDNRDGAGEADYTQAVRRDVPLKIERARGKWAVCRAGLDLLGSGLALPQMRAGVRVLDNSGAEMFAGVVEFAAQAMNAMTATASADDCIVMQAVETAWLTQSLPADELQSANSMQHTMALHDAKLHLDAMRSPDAELAADVTVSGEKEATEYVTELFRGDGATQTFRLQHAPFRESGSGTLLDDLFDEVDLNATLWSLTDVGSYLSLGSGGLRLHGGTGEDGGAVCALRILWRWAVRWLRKLPEWCWTKTAMDCC